jgi:DNA repair and recombination protein RAD54 and RAD54-like protein
MFNSFKCKRCVNNIQVKLPPEEADCTCDLANWFHCANNRGIPDELFTTSASVTQNVSFVFHQRSATKEVEPKPEKKKKKEKKMFDEDFSEPESIEDDDDEDYE